MDKAWDMSRLLCVKTAFSLFLKILSQKYAGLLQGFLATYHFFKSLIFKEKIQLSTEKAWLTITIIYI